MDNNVNFSRRNFLTVATGAIGFVGVGLLCIPFVSSWLPSAQAMAMGGPIDVDLSNVEEGKKITISWRGKPVFIVNRSVESLDNLNTTRQRLRDPDSTLSEQPIYTKNNTRSLRERYLVVIGLCTHLGCVPLYYPKVGELNPSWLGGFYCPCHGSSFDLAGRVYKGVPAPVNLVIPPHRFISDTTLRIGEEHKI